MIDTRSKRILLEEFASWHAEGLITDDQLSILRTRYETLPDTATEVAIAQEWRTRSTLMIIQGLGSALVVLGIVFFASTAWNNGGQIWVCCGLTIPIYAIAHFLFAAGTYPRSAVALIAIGHCALPVTLAVTLDYLIETTGGKQIAVPVTGVLTLVYLAFAVRTGSVFLSMFFAAALVALDLSIGFELLDLEETQGIIFCTATGAAITLGAYLVSSTPIRHLTAALGLSGVGLLLVSSFIGTFYSQASSRLTDDSVYLASYTLLFATPLALSVIGVRKGVMPLVYGGVITLWVALIRLFGDVFADSTGALAFRTVVVVIALGIAIIWGAIRFEQRRLAAERPARIPEE